VLDELDQLLTTLSGKALDGVILRSAKSSFIVGADVTEFRNISDTALAADLARGGQHIFERIAKLPFPSVALIHGHCLGGGLELALAPLARRDEATRQNTGSEARHSPAAVRSPAAAGRRPDRAQSHAHRPHGRGTRGETHGVGG
jgi:hypothetical protein